MDNYTNFFVASTGASTAFIGLLFVGMSIVNTDDSNYTTKERRIVLAGSSFLALIDIFFVSVISLLGGAKVFALSSLLMAIMGLAGTWVLIPRAGRAGNFARNCPTRRLNLVFAGSSISLYTLQLILAIAFLNDKHNTNSTHLLLLVIIGLYGSALRQNQRRYGLFSVLQGRRSQGSRRLDCLGFGTQHLWFCYSQSMGNYRDQEPSLNQFGTNTGHCRSLTVKAGMQETCYLPRSSSLRASRARWCDMWVSASTRVFSKDSRAGSF